MDERALELISLILTVTSQVSKDKIMNEYIFVMYLDMDLHVKKYACQSFDSTVTCVHIEINFFDFLTGMSLYMHLHSDMCAYDTRLRLNTRH